MGKSLKLGKSSIGSGNADHQPGCIGGMFHVLDYHHRGNKHQRKHRTICWKNPRTYSLEHQIVEEQPFLDGSKTLTVVEKSKRQTKMKKKKKKKKKTTISKEFSKEQVKEYVDILEILNANKEVYVKILKDPNSGFGKQFHIKGGVLGRLAKSSSFPVPGSSHAPSLRPITSLEHKQSEHWSGTKGTSLVMTLDVPSEHQNSITGSSQEQKPRVGESEDHGFNHMVMHGFREIKKWLRKALEDRKNKKRQYLRTNEKGVSECDLGNKESRRVKHMSSLNDSLERYSQLLEKSFRGDVKFHSKSLRLVNEDDKSGSRGNQPKFFRRVSSLSSLESFGSFLSQLSRDSTVSSTLEIRTLVDSDTKKSTFESEVCTDLLERQIASESLKDIPMAIEFAESDVLSKGGGGLVSAPETHLSDNTARKAETLFSEGSESTQINSQELSPKHKIHDRFQHYSPQEDEDEDEDDPYFSYLKSVLELSGFLANKDLNEKWHSEDKPMDPSLLRKLNPPEHEELDTNQLLFDLVNETLVDTYNQSHIYFPKAFSFTRRIYPMPKGNHLLDEVWERIQWSLFGLWTKKEDCSLDDLIAGDLAKADGWMNVLIEAEWLTLEIEDLILEEILDELVCAC